MDYDIKIKDIPEQKIASVRVKTTLNKVPEKVRQLLTETAEYLDSQGIKPAGPPLAIYYEVGSFLVDVEVGYPVPVEVEANERVHVNTVPGGKVAYTVYEGPHIDIPEAHRAVHTYLHEHDIKTTGDPAREVFLADPRDLAPDAPCRAESVWPIKVDQPLTRAERRRQEREQQALPKQAQSKQPPIPQVR